MSDDSRLPVVLCWHMHQPYYLDRETDQYQLPWTYLHVIKDYVDMAAVIEETPGATAVVNFAPTLLEQIEDYTHQIENHLQHGRPIRDPLLAALAMPVLPTAPAQRMLLIKACLRANRRRLIERFPHFVTVADLAGRVVEDPSAIHYFDQQFLVDLLVWYHLAWMGETVRRNDPRIKALLAKGRLFNQKDRLTLLAIIGELIGGVIGRYRALAQDKRIELSVTPYAHPIMPLLIDMNSAREAMPDITMPALTQYPGGVSRALWHIREGVEVFERFFGFRPTGCWPAEGSISRVTLELLAESGFVWAASGGAVLRHSLSRQGVQDQFCDHTAFRVPTAKIDCFFRDDGLSDLIGFTYSDWHADDAVNNLVHHLESIKEACGNTPGRIASVILDGENAWEYYPENGYHFLTALYRRLADHPQLCLTTFSEFVHRGPPVREFSELVAGSWVYGTFSTWIGDRDKNRGWDLLCEAKQAFDRVVAEGKLSEEALHKAERQLAICEGSDWFWWFGDYNPSESVQEFERLYRMHLAELYRLIGEIAPENLSHAISEGGGAPQMGGVMRRGQEG